MALHRIRNEVTGLLTCMVEVVCFSIAEIGAKHSLGGGGWRIDLDSEKEFTEVRRMAECN